MNESNFVEKDKSSTCKQSPRSSRLQRQQAREAKKLEQSPDGAQSSSPNRDLYQISRSSIFPTKQEKSPKDTQEKTKKEEKKGCRTMDDKSGNRMFTGKWKEVLDNGTIGDEITVKDMNDEAVSTDRTNTIQNGYLPDDDSG